MLIEILKTILAVGLPLLLVFVAVVLLSSNSSMREQERKYGDK